MISTSFAPVNNTDLFNFIGNLKNIKIFCLIYIMPYIITGFIYLVFIFIDIISLLFSIFLLINIFDLTTYIYSFHLILNIFYNYLINKFSYLKNIIYFISYKLLLIVFRIRLDCIYIFVTLL